MQQATLTSTAIIRNLLLAAGLSLGACSQEPPEEERNREQDPAPKAAPRGEAETSTPGSETSGSEIIGLENSGGTGTIEATSFLGEPLSPSPLEESFQALQEDHLRQARQALEDRPEDPEAWIWVGRRTAYLGRFREAVEIYTQALERHPQEARLFRHRGHRYLTLRQLDAAIADFERAAALTEGQPDQVEPDGLPNARGIPTSTLQFNIWYHLGLAYYLLGDFPAAATAYSRCLEVSKNPDSLVATTHWLSTTLRRLGEEEEAEALLADIRADLDIIENEGYHRLTLLYKGELDPNDLLAQATAEDGVVTATVAYGVGAWFLHLQQPERAQTIFQQIIDGDSWAAFGHLAAEAELARKANEAEASSPILL